LNLSVYKIDKCVPLRNDDYFLFLANALTKAQKRIWLSIFIIDIRVQADSLKLVRTLLRALEIATWKKLDVKVILGSPNNSPGIYKANYTTIEYLKNRNINAKIYSGNHSSLHSKYVLIDDNKVIVGSHNWQQASFTRQYIEDSILLVSNDLNRLLGAEFLNLWKRG